MKLTVKTGTDVPKWGYIMALVESTKGVILGWGQCPNGERAKGR